MGDWFETREFSDGLVAIAEPGHAEDVKSYLVRGRDQSLLFDTGMGIGNIRRVVDGLIDTPVLVVNSHSHWDHIGDNWRFERIWIHAAEAGRLPAGVPNARLRRALTPASLSRALPDGCDPETFAIPGSTAERVLHGGERIDLGDRVFEVIPTPGHSPGGITLVEERTGVALVGDAVYAGRLYAHLDDADPAAYRDTCRRLAELAPSISAVYPAHNRFPLPPEFLVAVHQGMEAIWAGRAPDERSSGIEQYRFGEFGVLLAEGWRRG